MATYADMTTQQRGIAKKSYQQFKRVTRQLNDLVDEIDKALLFYENNKNEFRDDGVGADREIENDPNSITKNQYTRIVKVLRAVRAYTSGGVDETGTAVALGDTNMPATVAELQSWLDDFPYQNISDS